MVINNRALNIKRFGLVLNRDKYNPLIVCSFTSCEFLVAGSGQFSSGLVHLLFPLHNTFLVTPASKVNQTNPLNIREDQPYLSKMFSICNKFCLAGCGDAAFLSFNFLDSSLGKIKKSWVDCGE